MTATATLTKTLVSLREVRKIYRMGDQDVHALAGVNLDISAGAFCAMMGPSGSGKSTMLNLLGCLDRPSSGIYTLENRNVGKLNDDDLSELRLRRLGFIFQSFNLIPQLTVQENIALPLFYLGWEQERSAKRATELAAIVGLESRLRHRPQELSGGQQQRVAIARALANDPAIILADEPTGNLDSSTGVQIMEMLTALHQEGKTLIMVTHEPDIAAYASVQIHMRDGKIDEVHGEL
ncbi:MAG: ABC transporter ATP-binding protein [Candidatus Hydrogenedentes bacterium]|nr:ABC transporter ATP-binding protein [Candidatus Hydrogenedentota bacterium]